MVIKVIKEPRNKVTVEIMKVWNFIQHCLRPLMVRVQNLGLYSSTIFHNSLPVNRNQLHFLNQFHFPDTLNTMSQKCFLVKNHLKNKTSSFLSLLKEPWLMHNILLLLSITIT